MTAMADAETNHPITPARLTAAGPAGQVKQLERALWHLGFDDVRAIDGAGDGGGDILAVRDEQEWVFQSKWSRSGPIDQRGVDEVNEAYSKYVADNAVIATNAYLTKPALKRVQQLKNLGLRIDVWNGASLDAIGRQMPSRVPARRKLRGYQADAVAALIKDLNDRNRALLILATGLGKTIVGGELISAFIEKNPKARVLVLSHLKELSAQLERAMWHHIPRTTATQLLTGESRPRSFEGLTAATIESALNAVYEGYKPDLIMIDEAHHVGEEGRYSTLLEMLHDVPAFGVTATPWRGDEFDLTHAFGPISFQMGIAKGMSAGWLTEVDYRLFVDNIDWHAVRDASHYGYSIKELNRRLFLPERDEKIIDEFRLAWNTTASPRAILFCESIDHAEEVARQLRAADPQWSSARAIHSGLSLQQRQVLLNQFRLGRVPVLTCVDVLNEGVDVPDVNLIAFLRVTHSRRIFVQQLGRGLRLAKGKDKLKVLDFVTDIRRIAAAIDLRRELEGEREVLGREDLAAGISFSDSTVGDLMDHWIRDAASLETAADEVRLQFPEFL